ncbi:MAG TPA: glycosyltransferase family 39 protein [Ignavibacteria bacterium]|nr:glycosyltransferase family 39 protein [Ignavibacteria bacterium]
MIVGFHAWRQADTASIAKNFYESGNSILYPQIDWRGNTEGFVESEFHIYPYLVSVFYNIFGLNEAIGRIVSIIFSVIATFYLFLLVKLIINEKSALWSAVIFSILPMNFFFSRAFMPESAMIMFSIAGIYFYLSWINSDKLKFYIFSLICISLAVLIKLPVLYLGIPLIFLSYYKYKFKFLLNYKIWFFAFVVILFVFLWYNHAHNLYKSTGLTFNIWNYGSDKWGTYHLLINPDFYSSVFIKSIVERQLTFAGTLLFIFGLFINRNSKLEFLFDWWLIAIIFFILFVSQGNLAQEYYQLPIVVPASVFIGKLISKYLDLEYFKSGNFKDKFKFSIVSFLFIFLVLLSIFRIENLISKEKVETEFVELINHMKINSDKNDKVISFTDGNPVLFYNIDRKGWHLNLTELNKIDSLNNIGAKFLIGNKKSINDNIDTLLNINRNIILDNSEYFIVKLN